MSHGRTLATIHSSIIRQISDAQRANRKLDFLTIKPNEVIELANWCVAAMWPPCSFGVARKAILDGKYKILGLPVKVV